MGQPAGGLGYLVYDPAGFMTLALQAAGRPDIGDRTMTPQDARAALDGYTALWGPFAVDAARGVVTHQTASARSTPHLRASTSPAGSRSTGPVSRCAPRRVRGRASRLPDLTWERLPDLPNLTPTHRKLIGIWRFVSWESRTAQRPVELVEPRR